MKFRDYLEERIQPISPTDRSKFSSTLKNRPKPKPPKKKIKEPGKGKHIDTFEDTLKNLTQSSIIEV